MMDTIGLRCGIEEGFDTISPYLVYITRVRLVEVMTVRVPDPSSTRPDYIVLAAKQLVTNIHTNHEK